MPLSPARILEALEIAGVEIDARAFADAVWLASHRFFPPPAPRLPKPGIGLPRSIGESGAASETKDSPSRGGADSTEDRSARRMDAPGASRSAASPGTGTVPVMAPAVGRSEGGPGGGGSDALPLQAPAGRALPGARPISRALRPFNRRVPAREHWQLDEEATIRRYAEDRLWFPVLRPARARWLEVALVVDTAPSMLLWQPVLREFRWLLERQGAFRDIREWRLDTMAARPLLRRGHHPVSRRPEELVDPAGRRLVLLASDCVAPAWRNPELCRWLRLWGRHQPVAIVQMLPARLWAATGLGCLSGVRLEAREPGLPNTRLHPVTRRRGPASRRPHGVPIPVVPLDPAPMRDWAALVAGDGFRPAAAYYFPRRGPDVDPAEEASPAAEPPDVAVARFRAEASETAFRLACLLAAAPLRLPVMRLVQQVMIPGSTQGHLAEVFLSGLIQRVTPETAPVGPDELDFEFRPEVRERLLSASYASEAFGVLRAVSRFVDQRLGTGPGFEAWLADPTRTDLGSAPPGLGRVFARVSAEVLGRMGCRYAEAARRLAEAAQPEGRTDLEPGPEGSRMAEAGARARGRLDAGRWRGLYDRCRAIAEEPVRGQALHDLARQALDHGLPAQALETVRSAIAIWEKRQDQAQLGHSRWLEACALAQSGQVAESSRAYLAAVASLDHADYRAAGQVAAEYADVLFRRGERREAERMYRRAATRFDAVKDVQTASRVRLALAQVCVALDRFDEALALIEYVIREFAGIGDRVGQAEAERILAELEARPAASELSSQPGPASDRSSRPTLGDARTQLVRVLAAVAAKRRSSEALAPARDTPGAPQGRPRRGLAGATILWVDNRPENHQREVEILTARGARVIQVTGSHEALRRLSEGGVDAILSDMGRSEGDLAGLQLLDSVRERGFFQPFAIYEGALAELYQEGVIARLGLVSTSDFDRVLEALESALEDEPPKPASLPRERVAQLARLIKGWGGDPDWARVLDRDPGRTEVWTKLWETIHADRFPERITTLVADGLGSQYVQLFRFENQERLVLLSEVIGADLHRYDEASLSGIIGRAALTGSTVYAPDVHADTSYIAAEKDTSSELAIPVQDRNSGRVVAVLNLESPLLQAFGARQVRWLEGLGRSLGPVLARHAAPKIGAKVTLYLAVRCPDEVRAGEGVPVNLVISREARVERFGNAVGAKEVKVNLLLAGEGREPFRALAHATMQADLHRPLRCELGFGDHLVAAGQNRVDAGVPKAGNPLSLVLEAKATEPGDDEIRVRIYQAGNALHEVGLPIRIRPRQLMPERWTEVKRPVPEAGAGVRPMNQVSIHKVQRGDRWGFRFILELPHLRIRGTWESPPLAGGPEALPDDLYRLMEERFRLHWANQHLFQQDLRELGAGLWDELIPSQMQDVLWRHRGQIDSLVVLTDDLCVPWELLLLKRPGKGLGPETAFLGELGLVRWLYSTGLPPTELRAREGRCRYVIPRYAPPQNPPPGAQAEAEFLRQKFKATPIDPQAGPVRKVLETPGSFDLLHFGCRCVAQTQDINRAELLLEGRVEGGNDVTAILRASVIEQLPGMVGEEGVHPIVTINAERAGRGGFPRAGLGEFARAFLGQGSGLFVAPLWSMGDSPKRHFFETFYDRLLGGETVVGATVAAREAARQAGQPNWLAYAVFGNPHARLVRHDRAS